MSDLNTISWNVKGLGNYLKRSKILSVLKGDKADIIFLQETLLNIVNLKEIGLIRSTFLHINLTAEELVSL